MQPLLKIQTVPIAISYSTRRAQLRRQSVQQPRADVTRTRGKSEIRTDPAKIKMDHYEMRASMGIKTAPRMLQESAQAGRTAAMESASMHVRQGRAVLDSHGKGNNPIAEVAMSRVLSTREAIMSFSPSAKPEMWVEGGDISFDYTMDQLEYNWQLQTSPDMEYEPWSIEFSISQYPEVIIEYLGAPVYVPPSSDPNYEAPPEILA